MNSRDRVLTALNHVQPDRTPADFQAVGIVWDRLFNHFHTNDMKDVLDALEIDCAWVDPEVGRQPAKLDNDGLIIGWGGSRIKTVKNSYGYHDEIVRFATDGCCTPDEIDAAIELPDLDSWDFSSIGKACEKYNDRFLLGGFASIFYYPTLIRSMEQILTDMALEPELADHLFNRCFEWHMEYHRRLMEAGKGRIDAMQLADDFSTQLDLLMSIDMFRRFFKKPMKNYVELAKSYGAIPFLHCCGSAYRLIPEFIDIGVKILDPVQTTTRNMEPQKLKAEFGDKLCFHGGGETQNILPHGTAGEVRENARMLSHTLGKDGGYILSSCHFFQADVSVENILAFYDLENR